MRDVHGNQMNNNGVIGRYLTATGKIGIEIREHHFAGDRTTYSYTGKWGAGSCGDRKQAEAAISSMLRFHPRHTIDINLYKGN